MDEAARHREVLARFGMAKHADDLVSALPMVAGAPVGGYVGKLIGSRYGAPDAGGVVGTILGALAGRAVASPAAPPPPAPSPYAIDPTVEDIPAWARTGAQILHPAMKVGEHNPYDVVLGEVPGYAGVEGYRRQGWKGALKGLGGSAAGGVAAGLGGHLLGTGLEHLIGRHINVPLIHMSLPELLAGFAGTIGATKGFRAALGPG